MAKKVINIGEQTYVLRFDEFDDDMDIDSILKIDYSNLIGEMVTFPVIVNRFGNLLADAECQLSETKLNLDILEAKIKERIRNEVMEDTKKPPTVEALNNAVLADKAYQTMRRKYIEAQKTRDYVSSVFWSAKDKASKLDKLSLTIQPGDVDEHLIEGEVNRVTVKKARKVIE